MSLSTIVAETVRPYFESIGRTDTDAACAQVEVALRQSGAAVRTIAATIEPGDIQNTGLPPAILKLLSARIREDAVKTIVVANGDQRTNLRPSSLDEIIGHTSFKTLITTAIIAARKQSTQLRHVLLCGPRGLGKTTLALAIAHELGVQARLLVGTQLQKASDVTSEALQWKNGTVVFIDEIHGMSRAAQETLYSVLEDRRLPLVERRQGRLEQTSVPAASVTIIGATTNPSKLLEPFRNRFGFRHDLTFYSTEEMERICSRSAGILSIQLEQTARSKVVANCRDNPRTLNELLVHLHDLSVAHSLTAVTENHVAQTLALNGYNEQGLRPNEARYLETLANLGGTASLKTIAEALDIEVAEVELTIEPWLIRRGLIRRNSKGRQLTKR